MKKLFTSRTFLFTLAFLTVAKVNAQDVATFFSDALVYVVPETIISINNADAVSSPPIIYVSKNTVLKGGEFFENAIVVVQKALPSTKIKAIQRTKTVSKLETKNQSVKSEISKTFPFGKHSKSHAQTIYGACFAPAFGYYKALISVVLSSLISFALQERIFVLIDNGILHKRNSTVISNALFARPPTFS